MLVAAAGSLFLAVPLRLVQVHRFIEAQREQIPAVPGDGRQIVFVRADRGFYAQDLVQNDPFLRGNRLIFFSRGEAADSRLAAENMAHPRVAARNEVATVWVDE